MNTEKQPLLRSFARRIGKSLSNIQKNLIEENLPNHLIEENEPLKNIKNEFVIEIGIGMAEHFINQCKLNPDITYIGCEPYLNGVANCLKLAKAENITNFKLWPDDADLVLKNIPEQTCSIIYILFPDPWPKTNQKKRRFVNNSRIEHIHNLLKSAGYLIFASDIPDYVDSVLKLAVANGFSDNNSDKSIAHDGYIQTKYNSKAIEAGRKPQFLILKKL